MLDASGPAQAMVRTEAERPDLILLDVMMPNATEGFHFVWELRQRAGAYFAEVPIVIVSAIHGRRLSYASTRTAGMAATVRASSFRFRSFLDKPVDPTELLRVVERVLGLVRKG